MALQVRVELELVDGRRRSGIGRLAARPDIAALAILFAFIGVCIAFYFGFLSGMPMGNVLFILMWTVIGIGGSYSVAWYGIRMNTLANSRVAFTALEKKPLKLFLPGTQTYSCGSFGCNLGCLHCQNWQISRGRPSTIEVEPKAFVEMAQAEGCPSVAFTYNEPAMCYEWVLQSAMHAHRAGLKTIMVTNGYINAKPLEKLLPHIDAMNIDLKAFTEEGYGKVGGTLEPVQHAIERSAEACHIEVTMLLVPGIIDSADEVEQAAQWLAATKVKALHLTRCFPAFRHKAPPTSLEFLHKAQERAGRHFPAVYLGNV
jgi:pyruvate formate lyase activating enzyme